MDISYAHAFSPMDIPVAISNLIFEHAAVLFNIAALYSQLGASEDRSSPDGVKRASSYYQASQLDLSVCR